MKVESNGDINKHHFYFAHDFYLHKKKNYNDDYESVPLLPVIAVVTYGLHSVTKATGDNS